MIYEKLIFCGMMRSMWNSLFL